MRSGNNLSPEHLSVFRLTEHLGNFSQMQILGILPNGGCRLRPCYMLSKTEIFFIARLVKPLGDRNSENCWPKRQSQEAERIGS